MSVVEIQETKQYLSFKLDREVFAVDVAKVREIRDLVAITRVPRTPPYMRGVINVRGSVVPVIDMRHRFGISGGTDTINTCIVIMEVKLDEEAAVIGAIVDSVQEVFDLLPEHIEPAPRLGTRLKTEFIAGIGKRDEKFVMILDIDRIFSTEELAAVLDAGAEREAA